MDRGLPDAGRETFIYNNEPAAARLPEADVRSRFSPKSTYTTCLRITSVR